MKCLKNNTLSLPKVKVFGGIAAVYTNTGADEINIFYWCTKGYVNLEDPAVKKFIEDNK